MAFNDRPTPRYLQVPKDQVDPGLTEIAPDIRERSQQMSGLYDQRNRLERAILGNELALEEMPKARQMLQDLDAQIQGISQEDVQQKGLNNPNANRFNNLRQAFQQR